MRLTANRIGCRFKSFIITRWGDVLLNDDDSYDDIINNHKGKYDLSENMQDLVCPRNFVRAEIFPPYGNVNYPISKWIFSLNEWSVPMWFKSGYKENAYKSLRSYIKDKSLVGKKIGILSNKNIIYLKNCRVGFVSDSNVKSICGNSKIDLINSSAIEKISGNVKINRIINSQVGTIQNNVWIKDLGLGNVVGHIFNNARVDCGSCFIHYMHDKSKIKDFRVGHIGQMCDDSFIYRAFRSHVCDMQNNSSININENSVLISNHKLKNCKTKDGGIFIVKKA